MKIGNWPEARAGVTVLASTAVVMTIAAIFKVTFMVVWSLPKMFSADNSADLQSPTATTRSEFPSENSTVLVARSVALFPIGAHLADDHPLNRDPLRGH